MAHQRPHDDAPKRTQKDDKDGELAIVGKSILISRPRNELFAYWRDFTNLPSFMHAIESVEKRDATHSIWTINDLRPNAYSIRPALHLGAGGAG